MCDVASRVAAAIIAELTIHAAANVIGCEISKSENVQFECVYLSDINDEEENVLNVRREQKRRRILSDSESENGQNV